MSLEMPIRKQAAAQALQASGAQTTTGTGTAVVGFPVNLRTIAFELDVTAAATAAGDTLDVFVQAMVDQTNWVDVVHFTQVLGNGGAKRHFVNISTSQAVAMFENASSLAAGSVRHLFGDQYRVRWVVASASSPSFTFSVWGCPQ